MVSSIRQLDAPLARKLAACRADLARLGRVCVAFSGGVDSTLVLALAVEALGRDNVLAVMAVSTIFPHGRRQPGTEFARRLGVQLVEMEIACLTDTSLTADPPGSCYYCKSRILGQLKALAADLRLPAVVTGSNASDAAALDPGLKAEEQLGIRRPLMEAGLTQDDVREICRAMDIEGWDRPSSACIVSQIPCKPVRDLLGGGNKPIAPEPAGAAPDDHH